MGRGQARARHTRAACATSACSVGRVARPVWLRVGVFTFVPRPFPSEPDVLRVPYYHRTIDNDEVIFYHHGDFFSRAGISPGMVTWHPQGIHHGPHPKAVEASLKKHETDEVAVMLDTERPLHVSEQAFAAEWPEYHLSWRE